MRARGCCSTGIEEREREREQVESKDESEEIDKERGLEGLETTGNCGDRGRTTREKMFRRESEC